MSTSTSAQSSPPLVLVHGAWHDSSCWSELVPLLKVQGLQVHTPDLPGHGNNPLPLNKVTLKAYVQSLVTLLESLSQPAIVVAHSMAGMILAQLSSERPELLKQAVYLCAYLPRDGESLFDLITLNRSHEPFISIELAMKMSPDKRSCTLAPAEIIPLFYPLAPPARAQAAKDTIGVQATLPLATRVALDTQQFARVPRTYICCTKDKVIPVHHQRRMLTRQTCQTLIQLDADHSPFFSAPAELAEFLVAIAS